jgi:hypothetical protein
MDGSKMKEIISRCVIALFVCASSSVVYADIIANWRPYESITIEANNLPDGEVYMDLLVYYPDHDMEYALKKAFSIISNSGHKYNRQMLSLLQNYDVDGWHCGISAGAAYSFSGNIACDVKNGNASMEYSGFGAPEIFKIIVISEDGVVKTSNVIERKSLQSTVDFDYNKAEAVEIRAEWMESWSNWPPTFGSNNGDDFISSEHDANENGANAASANNSRAVERDEGVIVIRDPSAVKRAEFKLYVSLFLLTWAAVIIIEGIILLLFKFSIKKNWAVFLIINTATQIIPIAFLALRVMLIRKEMIFGGGATWAFDLPLLMEVIIFASEAVLFSIFLKEHSKLRRVIYALTANSVSLFCGIVMLLWFSRALLRFLNA